MSQPLWKLKAAYGLPPGSIRAILALTIFGLIWYLLATKPANTVPSYLTNLMFIIMGYYFAMRSKGRREQKPSPEGEFGKLMKQDEPQSDPPPPLYLPRGSVRWMVVIGFASIAALLFRRHTLVQNNNLAPAGVTLILVAGFMLGVLRANIWRGTTRFLEDIRATLSLAACGLLIAMVIGHVTMPDIPQIKVHFQYEEILAALVGFYFGSKS